MKKSKPTQVKDEGLSPEQIERIISLRKDKERKAEIKSGDHQSSDIAHEPVFELDGIPSVVPLTPTLTNMPFVIEGTNISCLNGQFFHRKCTQSEMESR